MPRILLVDDDFDLRVMLRATLEQMGHTVTEAQNGREAVIHWQRDPHDLMLVDLIMPDQEGLETIFKLSRAHPRIKIIAMSAGVRGNSKDLLRMAEGLGAKRSLAKPFTNQELAEAVDAVLAAG